MARLPVSGSDSGAWGDVLNTFLQVGHSSDGFNIGGMVETLKSGAFTLAAADNGKRFVVTAAVTITVPTVGLLGNGFEVEVINDSGGTVLINGDGATDVSMADGEIACILEVNGKQRVAKGPSTLIS